NNGCTEAEAMEAAQKAQALQVEYNIDLTEAEVIEDGFETFTFDWISERREYIEQRVCVSVSNFTDTKVWQVKPSNGRQGKQNKKGSYKLYFYGLKSDVMFASWLMQSLTAFIERAAASFEIYQDNSNYSRAQKRDAWQAFVCGMCQRINKRLSELKRPVQVKSNDCRSLVVLDKKALIEASLAEHDMNFAPSKVLTNKLNNNDAFYAGYKKGEEAVFNRPIGDDSTKTSQIS